MNVRQALVAGAAALAGVTVLVVVLTVSDRSGSGEVRAEPAAATPDRRPTRTPRPRRGVSTPVAERTTVVLPDEPIVTVRLSDPDREPVDLGMGKWGSVVLPPGWTLGDSHITTLKGGAKTYWWFKRTTDAAYVVFDPEVGRVVEQSTGTSSLAADKQEVGRLVSDLEDGK